MLTSRINGKLKLAPARCLSPSFRLSSEDTLPSRRASSCSPKRRKVYKQQTQHLHGLRYASTSRTTAPPAQEDLGQDSPESKSVSRVKRLIALPASLTKALPWKSLTISVRASAKDDAVTVTNTEAEYQSYKEIKRPRVMPEPVNAETMKLEDIADGANFTAAQTSTTAVTPPPTSAAVSRDAEPAGDVTGKAPSDTLSTLTSYLPTSVASYLWSTPPETKSRFARKPERRQIRSTTRSLCANLVRCGGGDVSSASLTQRLQLLTEHLLRQPEQKDVVQREYGVLASLCLQWRDQHADPGVRARAAVLLALVGHVPAVRGRGIRLLALDGGGTRGLVTIEILKQLQAQLGAPIHRHFDLFCGVSTGGLIATMLTLGLDLDRAEELYKVCSQKMFTRGRLPGFSKLVTDHGYYDHVLWENLLQENFGEKTFLESRHEPDCPMLAVVSTLMNSAQLRNYVFRNYTYRTGVESKYPGSPARQFVEAIRASSAAPTYYREKHIQGDIHSDGGLLTNNPTGIALHEAKLLWPGERFQCVLSVGTGRFLPPPSEGPSGGATDSSASRKVRSFVESATDVEGVHTILGDLLPPRTYFRMNPYLSEDIKLDEVRPEKWDAMMRDCSLYFRKNQRKLSAAAAALSHSRRPDQRARDWVGHVTDTRRPQAWLNTCAAHLLAIQTRMRGNLAGSAADTQ